MSGLVSVVLPVYNGQKYISKSIESVLKQSYKELELIIVNDCSTDETQMIIENYSKEDSRIRIINNTKNMKLPKSLNIGFQEANGKYFTWTSDDNIFELNAIEKMISCLENSNADMVNANMIRIDANGKWLGEVECRIVDNMMFGNCIGACFLYTKEIAEKVGEYNSSLFLVEDYDYWLRIEMMGKIEHINENLYYYRQHGNSLTETRMEQIFIQTGKMLEKYFLWFCYKAKNKKQRFLFYKYLLTCLYKSKEDYIRVHKMIVKFEPMYLFYERWCRMEQVIRGKFGRN